MVTFFGKMSKANTILFSLDSNGIFQAKILATNQINNNVQSRIEIKAL